MTVSRAVEALVLALMGGAPPPFVQCFRARERTLRDCVHEYIRVAQFGGRLPFSPRFSATRGHHGKSNSNLDDHPVVSWIRSL